jgi:hypothetical protein
VLLDSAIVVPRPRGEKIRRTEIHRDMKDDLPPTGLGTQHKLRCDAGVVVLFGAIVALYFTREILIPFAFALTLTFLLTPVVAFLQRLHIGRVGSALATVLVSIAVVGGIGWIIANQLVDVANQLPLYRQNIHAKIEAFHLPLTGQLGHAAESVKEVVQELTGQSAASPALPPPGRSQTQRNPSTAPVSPIPVQMVEPPTNGWAELRDLGTPGSCASGTNRNSLHLYVFMLLKREDLRNRLCG